MSQTGPLKRSFDGDDDFAFVVCRICGDHRRVISGRHLSKHDTDRETYMEEYHLTPDELIAKDFRMIRSSRRAFTRMVRASGLLPLRSFINRAEACLPAISKINTHISTTKAYGFLAIGTRLCAQRDSIPKGCGCAHSGTREKLSMNYSGCKSKAYLSIPIT